MAPRGERGPGSVRRPRRGCPPEGVPARCLIRFLVVYHSRAGHTADLAAVVAGAARTAASEGSEVLELDCFAAGPEELTRADGVLLGTPARFGYMSGAMKDFLERVYYPCLEAGLRLPYGLFVKGDTDTSGAVQSVERIVSGMAWRRVLPVLEVVGETTEKDRQAAAELGGAFVAGLESGVF